MPKVWTDVYNSVEPNQLASLAEKATPVSADLLLIEDSAASGAKKKVQVGNLPGGGESATHREDQYIATAGQTVFPHAYPANTIKVYQNGILLTQGVDYTSDGANITLTVGATLSDEITVTTFTGVIGAPDLTDAEFDSYAVFDTEANEPGSGGTANVNFSNKQNQNVDCTTNPAVTVQGPAGKVGHFLLKLINSASLASINVFGGGDINWSGNTPPTWAGTTLLSLYTDGTEWYGSGLVDVRKT